MSPTLIETVTCNWCTRNRPRFRIHRLASNQAICDYCLEWHYHALAFLGGEEQPEGCQVCGKTWSVLREEAFPAAQVRLYVVPKDQILQLLCKTCIQPYLPKTAQLYKGTKFGAEGLKTI